MMTRKSGFTLFEILVVIAIISLIAVFALPKIPTITRNIMNSAVRDLATTVRKTYNSALMTGQVHRIAYDIKKSQYWVEVGPPEILLESEDSREKDEKFKSILDDPSKTAKTLFKLEETITRKKVDLPTGVSFEDLFTEQSLEPIVDGIAYTHIFPHGIAEQAVIHVTNGSDTQYTLVITPLLGKTKLLAGYVEREKALEQ